MKLNQLKAGALLSYVQAGCSVVITLAYTPLMLRLLGQSEYGVYTLASSLTAYLGLLHFGLSGSYIRFYTRYRAAGDQRGANQLNALFLTVYAGIALLALLCGLWIAGNAELFFGSKYSGEELALTRTLMVLLTCNLSCTFLTTVFTAFAGANEQFVFQRLLNLGKTLASPLLSIPVLLMGFGSVGMVLVTVLISLAADAVNVCFCLGKLKMRFTLRGADFRVMGEVASFSVFIALNSLIDQINWQVDKVILSAVRGSAATAVYGVAAQLNTMYAGASTAISGVFTPRIHRIAQEPDRTRRLAQYNDLFIRTGRIQFLLLSLVCSGLVIFGQPFIRLWAGAGYDDAYYIALLLILPATIPLVQNVGIEIQRAENKHRFRSLVYTAMALGNAALSIPMGIRWGGIGCAVGTALSLLLANGLIINWYYQKKIGLDIRRFAAGQSGIALVMLAMGAAGWLLTRPLDMSRPWVLLAAIAAYSLLYFAVCWRFVMNEHEKRLLHPLYKLLHRR